MPITLGDKKLGSVASPVTGLHLESSTTENDRALRLAYDGTFYSEMRQLGAAGMSFRNNSTTDLVTIDGVGRVITPFRPAFRATSDNTTQSLTNGVQAVIVFKVAETNIGSHYNTGNGRFTAPIGGFYTLSTSLLITQGGANRIDLSFFKNGNFWVACEFRDGGAISTNASVTTSAQGYLQANDYIEVVVAIGGANGSVYQEPKFWSFSGVFLG